MAYVRELLAEVSFPNAYEKVDGDCFVEKKLSENSLYQEVQKVVAARFRAGLAEAQMLAILKHSPEFKAINDALGRGLLWSGIQLQMMRI